MTTTSTKRRRPLIGVTGPDRGGLPAWIFTWLAVTRAGGRACRITPSAPCDPATLDGLVVGGGADVHPENYGEDFAELTEVAESLENGDNSEDNGLSLPRRIFSWIFFPLLFVMRGLMGRSAHYRLDTDRDDLEFIMLERALAAGLPVLGICRGEQLLNVHFGGRLLRDVRPFYEEIPHFRTVLPKKIVTVAQGSLLASIVGPGRRRVNALHEQAVCCVGEGLRAVATEDNGVVQAVEHTTLPFVLGVQWHPEFLPQMDRQQALFKALVRKAAEMSPEREKHPERAS
jgi:putative glutamine amidotransferase